VEFWARHDGYPFFLGTRKVKLDIHWRYHDIHDSIYWRYDGYLMEEGKV
jgi:hypothetical protein